MANNRFQIYCKKCLELETFGKYYPVAWTCHPKGIDDFIYKHSRKCWDDDKNADLMYGTGMFRFRTEEDEDEYTTDYTNTPFKLIKIITKI